jgi:hypothetical protein
MTKFKAGQKWRMRNGEIDVITRVCSASIRAEKHGHRYCDGCFCNDGDHDYDLVTLIKDAPEDDLHPCLERVNKLVVKEGVYGPFVVGKKLSGRVYVYLSKENITSNDFAQAAALFTALAMATEGVE